MDLLHKTDRFPQKFLQEMEQLLGPEEYRNYLDSFNSSPSQGLRANTGKISLNTLLSLCPGPFEPIPWIPNGVIVKARPISEKLWENEAQEVPVKGKDSGEKLWEPAKDPYHYAGLYYLQEPSAMTPAWLLPVKPGDAVLDLCAAPGGKATELGSRLQGRGILFANDISNSRAKALLKNLERFGVFNICVTSEPPQKLAQVLPEFFDHILVDAPCSGEGMFRKEPEMIKDWEKKGPAYYAPLQREILKDAVALLKPGGYLLYSTCTFSKAENEDNITAVLNQFEDLELIPLPLFPGACDGFGLSGVIRLFPHKIKGEGHFLALLHKREGLKGKTGKNSSLLERNKGITEKAGLRSYNGKEYKEFGEFLKGISRPFQSERIRQIYDSLYYLPEQFPEETGLRYLRTGLFLGELKSGRFEPSQALAMALKPEEVSNVIRFSHQDERVLRYLKGETIPLGKGEISKKGWYLVCVEDYPLGWAKGNGERLKNKYYPGWRYQ